MLKADIKPIISLLTDKEDGAWNVQELYHSLIEYIRSGDAISDMGHPNFIQGARGEYDASSFTTYSPNTTIYVLVSEFSRYLNNFDVSLIWYRDLSSWEKFCRYIVELKQIKYFKRHFAKVVKSHNHYLQRKICPSCGTMRYNDIYDRTNEIFLEHKGSQVYINCRRCGKYVLTHSAFQCLDTFEKKSKLYVYLATRQRKDSGYDLILSPKKLRIIIE